MQDSGDEERIFTNQIFGSTFAKHKLSFKDCFPIIEKIKRKIMGWSSEALTYAGRLQLVKSILLLSMQLHWRSVFLLPRAVIKKI